MILIKLCETLINICLQVGICLLPVTFPPSVSSSMMSTEKSGLEESCVCVGCGAQQDPNQLPPGVQPSAGGCHWRNTVEIVCLKDHTRTVSRGKICLLLLHAIMMRFWCKSSPCDRHVFTHLKCHCPKNVYDLIMLTQAKKVSCSTAGLVFKLLEINCIKCVVYTLDCFFLTLGLNPFSNACKLYIQWPHTIRMHIMTPIYCNFEDRFVSSHGNHHTLLQGTSDFPPIFVFLTSGRMNYLDSCGIFRTTGHVQYEPLIDLIISSDGVEIERRLHNDGGWWQWHLNPLVRIA